jgi:ABC-type microcin C transport system permease subunit YejB
LSLYLHFALLSSSASTVWEYQLPPSFTFSIVLLVMKTGSSFADIVTTYNLAQGYGRWPSPLLVLCWALGNPVVTMVMI